MQRWMRFTDSAGVEGFGVVHNDQVVVHTGDMFAVPTPTGDRLPVASVAAQAPCRPTKIVALWNNLRAAADKNGWSVPAEPLYFFKPPSSVVGPGAPVRRPASYGGRILYEGELGIVIGTRCADVAAGDVDDVIFGYTCVNDVTALDLITEDASFAQWSRAKSFDTFGVIGPVIATGIDPDALRVQTLVGGKARQDYPVSDMIFPPRELVHRISRDMTLEPGDVIACGTSLGAMPMRPGVTIEVVVDGVGTLANALAE